MVKPGLPKLIATDLDGTLVRSDDTVSAYTHEVLDRVRAAGIRIVGATGRGPRLTQLTRNDIRAADFLVLAQGGWVLDQAEADVAAQRAAARPASWPACSPPWRPRSGPLSVMVEALEHDDAPLWGDFDPTWRYPVIVEQPHPRRVPGRRRDQGVRAVVRPRRRRTARGRPPDRARRTWPRSPRPA